MNPCGLLALIFGEDLFGVFFLEVKENYSKECIINYMKSADDASIMPYGKYNGQPLGDIPDNYIRWMWENTDMKHEITEDTERGAVARYFKLAYDSLTK